MPFTIDHVMTLLVLLGTITSGHMFGHQAMELHSCGPSGWPHC